MQDSNGEYSNDVSYTLTQNSKWKYTLTVTANTEWINNEERVFPVRIDPTVQSGTPVIDTYVSLENNASNFASGALLLGNAFGYPDSRIFVKVNSLPTIPSGTALIDAKLSMQVNVLGSFDVGVFKATGNWTTGVTHSSAPSYINANSPLDIVTISQNGRTLWDITKLYKEWMNGATNNGVCLKGINIEGASSAIGAIVQACESTNYYVPNIEVTYVSMTGLEDYYSYYTSSAGSAGMGYVNGFTGNLSLVHPVTTTADEIMPFGLGITYNSNLGTWKLNIYESIEYQVISGYQHFKWTDADGTEHWFAPVLKRDSLGLFAPYQYNENGELEEVSTPTEFYDQDGLGLKLTYTQEGVYTISDEKGNSKVIANGLVVQISDQFGNVRKIEEQSDESIFVSLLPNGMTSPIVQLEIELITNGYTVLNRQTLEKVYVYYANGVISTIEHYQNTHKYASATYTYSQGKLTKAYDTISNIGIEYAYTNGKVTQARPLVEKENETIYGNAVGISYTNLASLYRTAGKDNVLNNSDDIFTKYVYDNRGRVVTAYSYDFNGNILGASNYDYTDMYEQEDVGAKQNNRLSSTATTGANAINLLQNLDLEDLSAWVKNNIANICTYSYPEDKYGFTNGMVHKLTTPSFGTYTQGVNLSAGVYTLSLSVCKNLFDTDHFALCVYDGSNNIVKMTDNLYLGAANNGKWSRESLTFEITTEGTYHVGVNMGVNSSSSYVYIDNAMLETGGGASPFSFYEDGSFTTANVTAFGTNAIKGNNAGMMGSAGISLNSNLTNQSRYKTTHFLDPNKVVQTVAFSTWAKATNAVASSNLSNSPSRFGIGITVTFQKKGSTESSYSTYKTETIFVPAEPSATDWQHLCKVITIAQDQQYYEYAYKQIKLEVSLVYDYNVGSAYFDNASLTFDGTQSKYDYNQMGYITSVQDQNGNVTQYSYASNQVDLTCVTDSQGRVQEYAYGSNHVVNASGYSGSSSTDEFYHRNAFGQIEWTTEGTDSINDTISTTSYYSGILDSSEAYFTKPSEIMDYNARSTYYTYDEYGRVLGVADETLASNGEYNAIKYIYNSYGELIGAVPATYDKQDNVLTEVTGGKRVDYAYNDKHILSEIISPSTEYNMVYNDFNAIDQILIGNTAIATYEYVQNNGNLKKTTLANGAYIEYTYDSVDRLVGVCYNGIEEARFVYSSSGSLSSIVDVDNSTTYSYYYSGAGKLISERMSKANGLVSQRSYEYDEHDRLSKRCVIYFDAEYSKEQTEEYYYNTDGNVERIVRGERNECGLEYTYDGLGRLSTQVKKGSDFLTTQYEYANLDTHVSSIITKTTTNGESTSYGYDDVGNITSITLPTGKKITYTYDNTSQLIREDNEPLGVSYKYNYDSAGNLTSVEEYAYTVKSTALSGTPTSTYAYTYGNSNWGDLLTKYRGVSNTYDQLGNPLTYYNGTSYTFTWDEGRQLASATLSGSTFTYKYNQDGIRVEKIANGVKHTYYLNGTQIEREVQSDTTTGELIRDLRYYYDIMGIVSHIEIYDSIGTRTKYTLETNIQGDVVAIYTDALTKVASYRYDAWGKCTVLNANGTENTNASFIGNINPFRYRGYYYDTDTGFYYLNSRYYDPQVKRFINADDIYYLGANNDLQSYNLYAYCSNNPVIYVDYSGHSGVLAAVASLVSNPAVLLVAAVAVIALCVIATQPNKNTGIMVNPNPDLNFSPGTVDPFPNIDNNYLESYPNQTENTSNGTIIDPIPEIEKSPVTTTEATKHILNELHLPTSGRIRFIPPKHGQLIGNKKIGFLDKFGNRWVWGSSRTKGEPHEWDVQLSKTGRVQLGWLSRDGSHINVSWKGHITHK